MGKLRKKPLKEISENKNGFAQTLARFNEKPLMFCIVLSLILNLIVEMLSRRSIIAGLSYLVLNPLIFLYNSVIILFTLSIAMFPKRKLFAYLVVSIIWLALGIANCVLLGMRTTPLAAIDFLNIKTALSVMKFYMSSFQIVMIALLLVAIIAVTVFLWFRVPRQKTNYFRTALYVVCIAVILFASTALGQSSHALGSEFHNLAYAYKEYGFVYCFSYGLVDSGIDKPEGYSEETVKEILKKIEAGSTNEPRHRPNIVLLQLESFFDINRVKGLKLSENPVPFFTELEKNNPSGLLTVPTIGAGTVNTEFEVISGMSLDYFGPGEYPYKTALKGTAAESVCYSLSELGYTSHAIHNHEGTFYERHLVFPNLGFDTFTSLEYMYDVEFNALGWAKDNVLTGEIIKTLNSTKGRDFVYAISVQGHGRYMSEPPETPYRIKVSGVEDEERRNEIEYYLEQLNQMDAFLKELVDALSEYDEDVILVIFGDHLPKLDISYEFTKGDDYQTEYVVWNNFGLQAKAGDLYAYELSAHVLGLLGINNGLFVKLNQSGLEGEEFINAQWMLEYDVLYGEKYAYGGKSLYEPKNMRMGTGEIKINSVGQIGDTLYIYGQGFNKWSRVYVNGGREDTVYVNGGILVVEEFTLKPGDKISVAQSGENRIALSETDVFVYR